MTLQVTQKPPFKIFSCRELLSSDKGRFIKVTYHPGMSGSPFSSIFAYSKPKVDLPKLETHLSTFRDLIDRNQEIQKSQFSNQTGYRAAQHSEPSTVFQQDLNAFVAFVGQVEATRSGGEALKLAQAPKSGNYNYELHPQSSKYFLLGDPVKYTLYGYPHQNQRYLLAENLSEENLFLSLTASLLHYGQEAGFSFQEKIIPPLSQKAEGSLFCRDLQRDSETNPLVVRLRIPSYNAINLSAFTGTEQNQALCSLALELPIWSCGLTMAHQAQLLDLIARIFTVELHQCLKQKKPTHMSAQIKVEKFPSTINERITNLSITGVPREWGGTITSTNIDWTTGLQSFTEDCPFPHDANEIPQCLLEERPNSYKSHLDLNVPLQERFGLILFG
jgi:hypothetical protein